MNGRHGSAVRDSEGPGWRHALQGQGRVSSESARKSKPRRTFVSELPSMPPKLRDSLSCGSFAPKGDGALRRAGGAV